MRIGNLFLFGMLGLTTLGVSSCCKEDPIAVQVVDPAQEVEYYVKGQVVSSVDETPLSGVKVTLGGQTVTTDAQGSYQLTLSEAKNYTVSFTKDGYVTQTAEANLTGAANRAVMTANVRMYAVSDNEVTVETDKAVVVTNDKNGSVASSEASAEIPAAAVTEQVKVTVTPYVPTSNNSVQEEAISTPVTVTGTLKNIVVNTSKDVVLNAPVKLNFKNTEGTATNYLKSVDVYRKVVTRSSDDFMKVGTATFDPETNNYVFEVAAGESLAGEYSLRVDYKRAVSGTVTGDKIYEKKVDNSNNYDAVQYVHNFEASTGWEYVDKGGATDEEFGIIEEVISGVDGKMGVTKVPYKIVSEISGNNILYFVVNQTLNNITYEVETNSAMRTVKIRKYLSIETTYTNESATQHSGGSSTM